ncbi:polysaccharide pyruvyl transferase family protein [Bacteroidales bacterium SW292]|nr:polysaccharide pyruvyl transferase family protein [Bacteroidales bacterium SW292]
MIRLFYYSNNFGDELSPYIINKLSGEPICYYNPFSFKKVLRNSLSILSSIARGRFSNIGKLSAFTLSPIIIGAGSLLESATSRCIIWGTGMAQKSFIPKGGKFLMTRGYLSRKVVEDAGFHVQSTLCGDPALLLPRLFYPNTHTEYKTGIVCHNADYEYLKSRWEGLNNINIIHLRGSNVEKVINEICSCSFIYSSSLHGLIVSHAYGIPALWFEHTRLTGDRFKFYDYFSSVHIPFYHPFTVEEVENSGFTATLEPEKLYIDSRLLHDIQDELIRLAPFIIKPKLSQISDRD